MNDTTYEVLVHGAVYAGVAAFVFVLAATAEYRLPLDVARVLLVTIGLPTAALALYHDHVDHGGVARGE